LKAKEQLPTQVGSTKLTWNERVQDRFDEVIELIFAIIIIAGSFYGLYHLSEIMTQKSVESMGSPIAGYESGD